MAEDDTVFPINFDAAFGVQQRPDFIYSVQASFEDTAEANASFENVKNVDGSTSSEDSTRRDIDIITS